MPEISKRNMDELVAFMLTKKTAQVRDLLARNGYADAQNLSNADLQRSFLKAIKDSATFRADAAALFADVVQGQAGATSGLSFDGQRFDRNKKVKKPLGSGKLNAIGAGALNDTGTAGNTTSTTSTSSSSSGGSFWSTLGSSLVNKDTLTSLFNTGLNTLSSSLQNKANKDSEERALELERIRLQQIQATKDLAASGGLANTGKLSGGAIAGIVIGGLAVVGLIVYLAVKKK